MAMCQQHAPSWHQGDKFSSRLWNMESVEQVVYSNNGVDLRNGAPQTMGSAHSTESTQTFFSPAANKTGKESPECSRNVIGSHGTKSRKECV